MPVIVKSLSRKTPDFAGLFDYMARDGDATEAILTHNLYSVERQEIIAAFEQNGRFLPNRKNGNYLYHEMLSLPHNSEIPQDRQEKALFDLARLYLEKRAPDLLAVGKVHCDKDHVHLHLMISANAVRSKTRFRLGKKDFARIQKQLEAVQVARYPELGTQTHYEGDRALRQAVSLKEKEFQLKARTGQELQKEELGIMLDMILSAARSETELLEKLQLEGLGLYQSRGAWGVRDIATGKKHRLKTLGVLEVYQQTVERFARLEVNAKEMLKIRQLQRDKRERNRTHGREDGLDFER